jgi:hypothetical protein
VLSVLSPDHVFDFVSKLFGIIVMACEAGIRACFVLGTYCASQWRFYFSSTVLAFMSYRVLN